VGFTVLKLKNAKFICIFKGGIQINAFAFDILWNNKCKKVPLVFISAGEMPPFFLVDISSLFLAEVSDLTF
jgi:hypothetical protein